MISEHRFSEASLNHKKKQTIEAMVLMALLVPLAICAVLVENLLIAVPLSAVITPILVYSRWKNFSSLKARVAQYKVQLFEKSVVFCHPNSQLELSFEHMRSLDVNMTKGQVKSLILTTEDKSRLRIADLENMDRIRDHLISQTGELNVKYHHWFHKN